VWRDHSADAPRSSIYATSEAQIKKVKQIKIITFETESRFSLREWEGSETKTWKNTAGRKHSWWSGLAVADQVQSAEVFSWTALYINFNWQCVQSAATCAEFDLCLTDLPKRIYRQYLWSGWRRRDLLSRLHVITSHNIAIFIYLFSHCNFLCFCSCLYNCVWRVSKNVYHVFPWAGSWNRYSSSGRKMRLENGF